MLWSPIAGKYLVNKVSPANLMCVSLLVMGSTFVCFGFISRLEDSKTIMILTSCLRLVEGMASATQWTTAVTKLAVTAKNSKEKEKYFNINSANFSVG